MGSIARRRSDDWLAAAGYAVKRPWMPLYVGDYLAKTAHLSTIQHGAYLLLILHYWANGRLPQDEKQLMAIARMSADEWSSNCQTLASFFEPKWRHSRIDAELEKTRTISEKRAIAGLKGAWSKHGIGVAIAKQMPTHSHSHIRSCRQEKKDKEKPTEEQRQAALLACSDELKELLTKRRGTA